MGKKQPGTVPNRHIYARISFLYQASAYLAQTGKTVPNAPNSHDIATSSIANADVNMENDDTNHTQEQPNLTQVDRSITTAQNLSRKLLTDLRAVTHKSLIRASPDVKRTICKYCDTLLVDGQTSSSAVENASKGGKKPWADVLVVKCHTCGRAKRFPVHPREQKSRKYRTPRDINGQQKTAKQEPLPPTESQTPDSRTT